jgi:hypothetical protein
MRVTALIVALTALCSSAFAAGIDSRAYSCAGLQSVIATQGFAFIDTPTFKDFAVAGRQFCSGSDRLESRAVATVDNPQCLVRYCTAEPNFEAE